MSDVNHSDEDRAAPNEAHHEKSPTSPTNEEKRPSDTQAGPDRGSEAESNGKGQRDSQSRNGWPRRIVARYGMLGTLGEFTCSKKITVEPGCMLLLQTERGIEIGEHVPMAGGDRGEEAIEAILEEDPAKTYLDNSGAETIQRRAGRVMRVATDQDLDEERHINAGTSEEMALCNELIRKHNLPMKLITCEHLFGGERIIFYFMAEGRVDFRQLVRDLAKEYQTRIEMRQVGARDEARLVADFEICGRQCCCKNFLKILRPVNMKMAKMQKATLDPSKVSGRCGRLRCCLRYEHEVYDDLQRRLPRNNKWVRTPDGEGKVIDRQIITQLVTVELENHRRVAYPVEEIEVLSGGPSRPAADKDQQAASSGDEADRRKEREDRSKRKRGRRPQAKQPESAADSTNDESPAAQAAAPEATGDAGASSPPEAKQEPPVGDRSQATTESQQQAGDEKPTKKRRKRRRRRSSKKKSQGDSGGSSK